MNDEQLNPRDLEDRRRTAQFEANRKSLAKVLPPVVNEETARLVADREKVKYSILNEKDSIKAGLDAMLKPMFDIFPVCENTIHEEWVIVKLLGDGGTLEIARSKKKDDAEQVAKALDMAYQPPPTPAANQSVTKPWPLQPGTYRAKIESMSVDGNQIATIKIASGRSGVSGLRPEGH